MFIQISRRSRDQQPGQKGYAARPQLEDKVDEVAAGGWDVSTFT